MFRRWQHFTCAIATASALGCSSVTSAAPSSGCDVSFTNVQPAGETLLATPFHDGSASALSWDPKLNYLDVLGGDLSDKPSRAIELELTGAPIADGVTIVLGQPVAGDPLGSTPRLDLATANADKLTARGGTVHFTTASATRLVFSVTNATMVVVDAQGQTVSDGPKATMAMTCGLDVKTN